ncbi:hypothetical protein M9M90_07295 [Phenylobacterium sp. LH3H17]|uniref:hypothetical protein n=1 Tax=Phenylobacterium sp. LH3H17 TaxID=2903901 RepID=UPI0020CA17B3|nr:hypothetical protein [Phenylobacterium sp. LH3H17]UTP40980.1 hypothetical protein M9M90_07295 [Phenylobacterium sp. LH3H17]
MAKRALAFALLIGSSTLAFPAAAQVTRNLSGSLGLGVVTDSNVARTSDAVAALRGIEQRDTILTPSATIDWTQPVGRNSVFLRGQVGYQIYEKNTELSDDVVDLQGGVGTRIGPCQGTLLGSFSRRQRDIQDLGIPDPRVQQDTRAIQLDESCGLTSNFGVQVGVGQTWGESSGAIDDVDYDTKTVNVGMVFRSSTLGEASIFYSHSETDYTNALLPAAASGYEQDSVGLRYTRKVGSRITGTVAVSQSNVEAKSAVPGLSSDYSGVSYAVELQYRASSRLELNLLLNREVNPSVQAGGLYGIYQTIEANGSYQIGTRLTYSLAVSRRDNEAKGVLIAAVPTLTESRSDELRTGLRFQQSERLSFMLDASHTKYDANDPMFDYSATRVGLTTSLNF